MFQHTTENQATATASYYDNVCDVLARVTGTQMPAIEKAAGLVADTAEGGGIVYAFGSGHSMCIAIELYFRAGGLACVDIVHDKTFGRAERLSGYAAALLDGYPVSARDLLIVISNSGRNALPVEMAREGKKRGVAVIGITSLSHSASVEPRNGAGARLCEVCDVVIDNCGVPGDASVTLEDGSQVGPTSTIAGAFIGNCIVATAAEELLRRNVRPPLFISANLDAAELRNAENLKFLRERIRGL